MVEPNITLYGPDERPLPPSPRAQASASGVTLNRGYVGASFADPDLAGWWPFNWSGRSALAASREPLVARIHDTARNDGWASGGLSRQIDAIFGAGWWLTAQPNATALGIDDDAADELAEQIEAEWEGYAEDPAGECLCDAGGRNNFGGQLALAGRHRALDGEAVAAILWRPGRGRYATCLQVIDPDRLSTPGGKMTTKNLQDGVALNNDGAPVGYWFRDAHPGDYYAGVDTGTWSYVPRFTSFGRAMVVHALEQERAGETRGKPLLAPIVKKLRMLGNYDQAELQAAVLNAVMAAFVESPYDADQLATAMSGGEELSKYQDQRLAFYKDTPLRMGGVKVNFTYPGEKVNFTRPSHPNAVFEPFVRAALRNIASALGLSYEQLSNDWGQVNYSSARAALIEVWRGFTARRGHFAHKFVQPFYAAWLEEGFDKGFIKLPKGAPKFRDAKAAYCAAEWIGPGRGWVDPEKEARGAILRIAGSLSTHTREAAEQGMKFRKLVKQQTRERKEMAKYGLNPDAAMMVVGRIQHPVLAEGSSDQTGNKQQAAA